MDTRLRGYDENIPCHEVFRVDETIGTVIPAKAGIQDLDTRLRGYDDNIPYHEYFGLTTTTGTVIPAKAGIQDCMPAFGCDEA